MNSFWEGFEKQGAPRWLKELKRGNKALKKHFGFSREESFSDLIKKTKIKRIPSPDHNHPEWGTTEYVRHYKFPKFKGELSVPELKAKGEYKKLPGLGYQAPMDRTVANYQDKPYRLIGKEKGTVHLYHGTGLSNAESIMKEGLTPPYSSGVAFATPKEDLAKRYGSALLEADIPVSDISGLGGYYGGAEEIRFAKPTHGWKIKSIKKD